MLFINLKIIQNGSDLKMIIQFLLILKFMNNTNFIFEYSAKYIHDYNSLYLMYKWYYVSYQYNILLYKVI